MRRRLTTRGKFAFGYFGVLAIALVVGIVVPGGTGDTILGIAAGILAISVLAAFGLGKAREDALDRRGRRRF